MKLKASIFSFFILCLAWAAGPVEENAVQIQLHVEPTTVAQNGKAEVTADFTVAPDHHVYFDNLKVDVENKEGFFLDTPSARPLVNFIDPFTKTERATLEGQSSVTTELHVPPTISLDPRTQTADRLVTFSVTYQVCSMKVCQFPKTKKFNVPLKITSGSPSLSFKAADGLSEALAKGRLWAYIFVFIGGLLTSFTPCIFPMIPITISIIGARSAQHKKSKAFLLSVFYVLGIAFTYSLLGVLAASTGAFFGSLLGNIWVVGFISMVFLIMGVSMLGVYDIQAPAFVRNRLGAAKTGSGFGGAFFMGLISGIVASPCIGPVLVSILTYVAQTAKVFFGFTLLFTFAIGMGLIFIVLGTFSGLLSKLPKAGKWMMYTKIVFGVVLIGMSIYYILPFVPSFKQNPVVIVQNTSKIPWENYSDNLIVRAALEKKPVIIDMWAEWCAACTELDEKTYPDPTIVESSKNFVMLKFDATHMTPAVDAVLKKYNVLGLPTVIFMDRSGQVRDDLTITGFVPAPEFLAKMKQVK